MGERKHGRSSCLFWRKSWSVMVEFNTQTHCVLTDKLRLYFSNYCLPLVCLLPSNTPRRLGFECCAHLAWTQVDGAWSIHCTTQVKVIETGTPLPCSPVSKHMAAEHLERQRVRGTSWPRWERRRLTLWKQKVASTNQPCSLVACLGEITWLAVDIATECSGPSA